MGLRVHGTWSEEAIRRGDILSPDIRWIVGDQSIRAVYGDKNDSKAVVTYEPLVVLLLRGEACSLFHMDTYVLTLKQNGHPSGGSGYRWSSNAYEGRAYLV
jgi:hypothetical protein